MRQAGTLVIGLGHKAEQGKDEVARAILQQRGSSYDIRLYSFAQALRNEVAGREEELCRIHELPYEPDNKHRTLLQWYGTEYRRAMDANYWVKKVAEQIAADSPQIAIITDCRFPNEMELVEETMEGISVKVTRAGHVSSRANNAHASEIALDDHDFMAEIIAPSGDIALLSNTAVALFDALVIGMGIPAHTTVATPHATGEDFGDVTHQQHN